MAKTNQPGPGLWLSIITLSIGTIAASLGLYLSFQSAFELLNEDSFEIPGEQTRSLDPGKYEIYTLAGSMSFRDFEFTLAEEAVRLDAIRVTNAETGEEVEIEPLFTTELGRSSNVYESAASFEVVSTGRYTVSIDAKEESRAVFGRSIESAFDRVVPWLIATAVGVVLFVLGMILLIIGMVRRKRHRDPISGAHPPGPGTAQPPLAPPPVSPPPLSQPSVAPPPPSRPNDSATPW